MGVLTIKFSTTAPLASISCRRLGMMDKEPNESYPSLPRIRSWSSARMKTKLGWKPSGGVGVGRAVGVDGVGVALGIVPLGVNHSSA